MALVRRVRAAARAFRNPEAVTMLDARTDPIIPVAHRDRYQMFELYYEGEVYRQINRLLPSLKRLGDGDARSLENPTEQVVEFYAMHLFPGDLPEALPIVAQNTRLAPAIELVWRYSNWAYGKQVYARHSPLYGDAFKKAAVTDSGKPYMQLIHPSVVSDFAKDSRGNLIYVLIERKGAKQGGGTEIEVEEWSRDAERRRTWVANDYGSEWSEKAAGSGEETPLTEYGIDFVPFVHAPFIPNVRDPKGRGISAISYKIGQIDEINRAVTALHDRWFRYGKPDLGVFANESGRGAPKVDRRPSPGRENVSGALSKLDTTQEVYEFPHLATVEMMVPNLDYGQGLAMIRARQDRLAEQMAELRYFADVVQGDPSGLSRRVRLAPGVSRAIEARGNAEAAMISCQKMCLTRGQKTGAFRAANIEDFGLFEKGDLDHAFAKREVLPSSEEETARAFQLKLQNAQQMLILGYSPDEISRYLGRPKALEPVDPDQLPAGGFAGSGALPSGGIPGGAGSAGGTINPAQRLDDVAAVAEEVARRNGG